MVTLERKLLLPWLEVDFPLPEPASLLVTEGAEPRVKVEVDELAPSGGVSSWRELRDAKNPCTLDLGEPDTGDDVVAVG